MKKLTIFVLALAVLPFVAMAGSPDTPEAQVELEVMLSDIGDTHASQMSIDEEVALEGLVFSSISGGFCIDSGQACGPRGNCDGVCGTLTCECLNGTCQHCP